MDNRDCIFCQIVAGKIPAKLLYDDEDFIAFSDIHPHARKHLLIAPRRHIPDLPSAFPEGSPGETDLMGRMLGVATRVARDQQLLPGGFRVVINTGPDAGQTVFHLHLHVIGGEPLDPGMGRRRHRPD